jgi:hypothetical protein
MYEVVRGVQLTAKQYPNQILSKKIKGFSQKTQEGEKEEQVTKTTPNFSKYVELKIDGMKNVTLV